MKKGVIFIYTFLILAVLSMAAHNLIFALWQIEEGVFFILTLLFFTAFIGFLIYNTLLFVYQGRPKDLWKLGWLGLIGLLGLTGNFGLFGFFGFFGFLGMKKRKHTWK